MFCYPGSFIILFIGLFGLKMNIKNKKDLANPLRAQVGVVVIIIGAMFMILLEFFGK